MTVEVETPGMVTLWKSAESDNPGIVRMAFDIEGHPVALDINVTPKGTIRVNCSGNVDIRPEFSNQFSFQVVYGK